MPSHGNLERLIGTALVDGEFRASFLHSPVVAAVAFDLSEEELGVLSSANATSLEELAAHVHAWITRAPKPRRAPSARWAFDGYQAARAAV